jgi:nicotinamide-nucleotide amidase
VVVGLLARKHLTLATAESCTGGLLASRITDVPGASAVFTHGLVTYANAAKTSLLDVPAHTLDSQGAVCETVACQMAAAALRVSGAHLAVAVTGIAGPDGGTPEKPVGTAWIALAIRNAEVTAFKVFHPLPRLQFKRAVCDAALDALRRRLVDPDSHPFQE